MSLRSKLTIALLLMSFAAIALTVAISRNEMLKRFDDYVVDRAARGFISEVIDYHNTYGSFNAALASESFFDFVARTRPGPPGPPDAGAMSPDSRPPPGAGRGPMGPTMGQNQADPVDRRFPFGGPPPPFALADRSGVALLPLAGFEVGEVIPEHLLSSGRPILDGTTELGLAVALERPILTDMEEQYVLAIEEAWRYSLFIAALIAIPIGLYLGNRLTRPIRDITSALGEMSDGRLRQEVVVQSNDEVGQLATSFNAMSKQLSDAYEELESSRTLLDARAKEMAELSRHDPLTGLLNRRGFEEPANALISHGTRYGHELCVAILDIDNFKQINDEFSHAKGDEVLKRTAELLEQELRKSDLVARYGGEEFVIIFPQTSLESAQVLAERLRNAYEKCSWSDLLQDRAVTISIGVSRVETNGGFDEALANADEKLYEAKNLGRNRVVA